ncbi:cobalamin B12-binding domain-containing protein [Pyxidicoccus xibeiensis]|uniref:cobalamin B12-binding domain-containing protein n=1 Tax=Pyxidicoccus xibeiensis TaxID=2906759 RepID=UPI0020A7DE62|nr:cobalamin-dependent protein [Pyxidicoccus xibeiensis]MCP3143624.1 cobalamin-dependent protein [Pyxidicoccus xibeiensis]
MSQPQLPSPSSIVEALLDGDSELVLEAAQRYLEAGGASFLVDRFARPLMEEVGERWHNGRVTVAQEHAATELLRELLTPLLPGLGWHQGGPRAVVACAPGERHLLGARLVSQVLALDGWHVRFLGADTPARDLASFIAREQPVLAGLSVTMPENVPAARLTLELLHQTAPDIPLIVGGQAAAQLGAGGKGAWSVLHSTDSLLTLTRGSSGALHLQR